ncbi:MAG TPA: helix-turn-helix domain-containing protein [Candidatus Acidoferrales bacterium]|nr:helix-turn-helix domain-containing protein [Candidatus Acidoferrales bacterium]
MTITDSHVETLEKLGLTQLQAKIYLTTVTLQRATAGKIATIANVARPDVYRILPSLEKIGLLRKVITTPSMYEATPLKEGCDILLKRKKSQYLEAEKRSQSLIEEFNQQKHNESDSGAENFSLINSKELLFERFAAADETTKKTLDIISDWITLKPLFFGQLDTYANTTKRGIRIRLITEKDKRKDKKLLELEKQKHPLFEVRYLTETVPIRAAIYDGRMANMRVRSQLDLEMTPSLWSDNPEFMKIMVSFFEDLWVKAEKTVLE